MVLDTEMNEKLEAHRAAKQEESKNTVIATEELEELKTLQTESDQIVVAFGQLALQELAVKKQRETVEGAFYAAKDKESELAKRLSDKYGQGTLDIESGKFSAKQ